MKYLNVEITSLKNISHLSLDLPMEKGLYAITGTNGTGKSTIMRTIAKLVHSSAYKKFQPQDYNAETSIKIEYEGVTNQWRRENGKWKCDAQRQISIQGFYEGSIIHGTRFSDANYSALLKAENVRKADLTDADDYVKENLSYILHGDKNYYRQLKRIKNLSLAKLKNFNSLPYFIEGENGLVNQFCMSTGENMLISLLHIINTLLIKKKHGEGDRIRLILIDEIELALHPSAIMRLLSLLQDLATEYNLCIYFSSHSVELIRQIKPQNMFYLEREQDGIHVLNPCRPAYATCDIYQHSGYDILILVEDELAKKLIMRVIEQERLYVSTLINVLPVGGWENVLKMHNNVVLSKIAGPGVKICSVLDGDAEQDFKKKYLAKQKYTNLAIGFLPVMSLEKYLHEKLYVAKDVEFFKEINDRFFQIIPLKEVISKIQNPDSNKVFYDCLLSALNKQGIDSNVFEEKVCELICNRVDLEPIKRFLFSMLNISS